MNNNRLETEFEIENNLSKKLIKLGYKDVSSKITTIDEVNANIKFHIERLNSSGDGSLNGTKLDNEKFENYILKRIYRSNIFENGKMIRDLISIPREGINKNYWLKLFDFNNLENNIFEFSRQVKHKSINSREGNRSDVTIFINGIPIVQIELKRNNIDIGEAFNQIQRYKKESFDIDSPFKLVQIFIISGKTSTKYFANANKINKKYFFKWTDEKNDEYSHIYDVADSMLNRKTLFDLVINYMIFTIQNNDETILILRPYQYYAVQKIINHINETEKDNFNMTNLDERTKKLNGYIWHATGSGKTLTSFKVAQLLSNKKFTNIEKSIFLVDRLDLNSQTIDSFNLYLNNENKSEDVKSIEHTDQLKKEILDPGKKIIVTTMQKMNNLIKRNNFEFVNKNKNFLERNFVFIIDECHRTQFGEMHKELRKAFVKSRFIGFTGTPIFPTEHKDGLTTEEIFGKCLHNYKMINAIHDENVLGFNIEYIKGPKQTLSTNNDIDKEVIELDKEGFFKSYDYIEKVIDFIYKINDKKTLNKHYKSMLVCSDIDSACKYYFKFREKYPDLKVATLFSKVDNNEKTSEVDDEPVFIRENQNSVMKAYNKDYGRNYTELDFKKYSRDIQNHLKDRSGEIQLIIVVKMLTTGFDAKPINTIYLDRSLKMHELIQTISRANRVDDASKLVANVISFRTFKKHVDEAIIRYCDEKSLDQVLYKQSLDELINGANEKIKLVDSKWPNVIDIKNEMSEQNKKEFVDLMKGISKLYSRARTFIEFDPNLVSWSLEKLEEYRSVQRDIYRLVKKDPIKEPILNSIDFELDVFITDEINVDYILAKLKKLEEITDKNVFISSVNSLLTEIKRSGLSSKAKLIEEFINNWKQKMLNGDDNNHIKLDIDKSYNEFVYDSIMDKVVNYAKEYNLNFDNLRYTIQKMYKEQKPIDSYREIIRNSVIEEKNLGFSKSRELINNIIDFIDGLEINELISSEFDIEIFNKRKDI